MEPEIGNYQMGFRLNRSTIDNIFMVRQIYEKYHEYNIDLHNIFIDFSQTFDTVNRDAIYNSLIKHNVPDKLIKLIKLTMQQTKMKVKVNNSYSEWFETKTGVRQGDPLPALLFSVVLDSIITNVEVRGNITARCKIETDLCLCRRHCNNWKNKTNFNCYFLQTQIRGTKCWTNSK
jgi:hypothetical protein